MSSSHSQLAPVRLTLLMCGAEILSMTGFAAYTTLLPALQRELMNVVSKYVKVQSKDIQMNLQHRANSEVLEVRIQLPQAAR